MRTISLLLMILISYANIAHAENVKFKTSELTGQVLTGDYELTDAQARMTCHFDFKGKRVNSIRYPQTFVRRSEDGVYDLTVREGSLVELMLPGFNLLTCAYKLLFIARTPLTDTSKIKEVFLLGQESGVMSKEELKAIQNPAYVNKVLAEKAKALVVEFDTQE